MVTFWNKITVKLGNDPVFIDPKVDPYDRIKLLAIKAGGFSMSCSKFRSC